MAHGTGSFLHGRSGYELRVIGNLAACWPFDSPDTMWSAAHGMTTFKRKYAGLWEGMQEAGTTPHAAAEIVVDTILSEISHGYRRN